jgi:hypothetical protein
VVGVVSIGDVRLAAKMQENAALQDLARTRLEVAIETARAFRGAKPVSM